MECPTIPKGLANVSMFGFKVKFPSNPHEQIFVEENNAPAPHPFHSLVITPGMQLPGSLYLL